ncbi:hypothetical protein BBP40_012293 [Aspergillus hancockii]|nr:hypothetical protein BBP40_012293 [Aspergillus hancockii]
MPPPPDGQFTSEDEAVTSAQQFAKKNHYCLVMRRTKRGANGLMRAIYLECDQGRIHKSESDGRRQVTSRRKGCPSSLLISYAKTDNLWHLKIRDPSHNHPACAPSTHSSIRRNEILRYGQYIKALVDIRLPTRQIIQQLWQQNPNSTIQPRDIVSLRQRPKDLDFLMFSHLKVKPPSRPPDSFSRPQVPAVEDGHDLSLLEIEGDQLQQEAQRSRPSRRELVREVVGITKIAALLGLMQSQSK